MKLSVKQIVVMALTFLLTVGILRLGQWLYTQSAIDAPLLQAVRAVPGVQSATWLNPDTLTIALSPSADLMATYEAVKLRASALGMTVTPVVAPGRPDAVLRQLDNQIHFAVAQGEATGQYVAMDQAILAMARARGVTASVELGQSHLFITLRRGAAYYFEVLPVALGGGGAHG
ncbi:MAG: hypothetical protein K6U14_04410 [Firmicutes bacterium]|nr:hypothetical protein [Alicyclobacillaceae bacterium]MCL6496864.1 hypothetical protein [Bacillota bacterium]